jgi:hypothetical protein
MRRPKSLPRRRFQARLIPRWRTARRSCVPCPSPGSSSTGALACKYVLDQSVPDGVARLLGVALATHRMGARNSHWSHVEGRQSRRRSPSGIRG